MRIVEDGLAIEAAGAVGFEIEAVPAPVAKAVDDAVKVFTFGIGAGNASCGQLLLAFDLLGVFDQFKPKFTKRYAQISDVAVDALRRDASEVREGTFPDADHAYGMKAEEDRRSRPCLRSAARWPNAASACSCRTGSRSGRRRSRRCGCARRARG